jgi:hypothetical protein
MMPGLHEFLGKRPAQAAADSRDHNPFGLGHIALPWLPAAVE